MREGGEERMEVEEWNMNRMGEREGGDAQHRHRQRQARVCALR